ncbi:Plant intracellular Ras-group-related LRR protein 3, partial [Cucurbita argyrosperma subsp. sororia]
MSGEEGRPFWTADQVSAGGVWKISPIDLKLNVCRTISWRNSSALIFLRIFWSHFLILSAYWLIEGRQRIRKQIELPETLLVAARWWSWMQVSTICEAYLQVFGYGLVNLEWLSIQLNKICYLPTSIGKFNNLTEVPESTSDLCNLRELDLSDNQIRSLLDRFRRLKKLIKLIMDQNPRLISPMGIVDKGAQAVKDFMDIGRAI